jgi:hypothetical protein
MKIKPILILPAILLMSSLACIVSDVKDAVDTVSKAVTLLQEIDESGTWKYIGDGVDAIDKADGFAANIQITEGTSDSTGQNITTTDTSIRWAISSDAEGDATITTVRDDETTDYVVINKGENPSEIYLVTDAGNYECQAGDDGNIFATDIGDAFAQYSALAVGVQVMSVANEDGKETVNGFSTTKYTLESKLEEAIEIMKDFPSDELQKELEDVPDFYINGTLYIDNTTKALVRFEAQYADLDQSKGNQFTFDMTELGNQPDVSVDPAKVTVPCTVAPTPTPS